ncbi:MAG: RNA polymerase factor sigma-54 [Myxococcota bacterium]
MNQSLGLRITQTQKLVMTQQLQQAIKLLQLNHMELVASIEAEMRENPTLEEIPGTETRAVSEEEMRLNQKTKDQQKETAEQHNGTSEDSVDWEKFLEAQDSSAGFKTGASAGYYDDLPPIENTLSTNISLVEHLLEQLSVQLCTDGERRAAAVMILNLDDHGWLDCTYDYVAEEADADMDDVEGAAMILHSLDPIGCGARGLEECLLIQVKAKWPEDPFFPDIVTKHLADIEARNYGTIAKAMDMHQEDVIEYHRMLQQCDPWPGRPYVEQEDQYITPDIEVVKVGGEWQIVQNDDGLPRLRVSPHYRQMLLGEGSSKDDKKYVEERLKAAKFLIESIYKRQKTIYKVMDAILRRQQDFFEHGARSLKPLVLRDIAEEIGVHESTVSRATTNKYVQCPHGIYELKFFFNASIGRTTGDDLGAEAVKERIRRIVSAEDKLKPLSDSAIARSLKTQNIKIARRTVAKYREAMGILPSTQRKKMF